MHQYLQFISISFLWGLLLTKLRLWFTQKTSSGLLRNVNAKHYELTYFSGEDMYIVRFPKSRGPSKIQSVSHIDDTLYPHSKLDVTARIRKYMGPANNFHGIPTTPVALGYSGILVFTMMDGSEKKFVGGDIIQLY